MLGPEPQTLTRIFQDVRNGRAGAVEALFSLVYGELRGLARACFAAERGNHTLQPTALIHEAWLKLAGGLGEVEDRRHFFALASRAMRQVLTDHARGARRLRRGDGAPRATFDGALLDAGRPGLDLVDLDDSLVRLAGLNERHARLVELRFFGGLTIAETAATLGISRATVEREWFMARAWLRRELASAP